MGWKACKTALEMPGNNLSLLSTCTYIGEFPHITCLSYTDLTCALDRFPSPQHWFRLFKNYGSELAEKELVEESR